MSNVINFYNPKVLQVSQDELGGLMGRSDAYHVILAFLYDNRTHEAFQEIIEKYDITEEVSRYGKRVRANHI